MVYCECQTEDDVKQLIQWARVNQGIIIPIGGNTNLVEASICQPSKWLSSDDLVLVVSFKNSNITYCKESTMVTCGPMTQLGELNVFLENHNRRWDLNFSAQSATIGGIISTNAGGELAKASTQLESMNIICGDGVKRKFHSHHKQTDSVFPNDGTATQGMIGMITSITLKTKPKWAETCSAMIELPINLVTEFREFVINHSPMVACELIDANSMKSVTHKKHSGMTLLLKWASEAELDLDDFWEKLIEAYPKYMDNMMLSDSLEKEEKLWTIRHDVSDANRRWASENNMSYIGYDLGIPKKHLAEVIQKIEGHVQQHHGVLFCFGHSMQSSTHDTIHCNIAMPQASTQFLPAFIQHNLGDINIQMAVEHGGCGHKSINDSLISVTDEMMEETKQYLKQYDPYQLFRRDIKVKMDRLRLDRKV
ncbi:hypothetical protein DID73_01850 [Candidatus Marinamargulisbacteria bacterium SCGC AG-343-K17]|nr:hypothetical protein DID73_01850 [Candidatus Marinamargulisbacteria bacterium SCGC AG-343-K17]